jgi:hypothetical protein
MVRIMSFSIARISSRERASGRVFYAPCRIIVSISPTRAYNEEKENIGGEKKQLDFIIMGRRLRQPPVRRSRDDGYKRKPGTHAGISEEGTRISAMLEN